MRFSLLDNRALGNEGVLKPHASIAKHAEIFDLIWILMHSLTVIPSAVHPVFQASAAKVHNQCIFGEGACFIGSSAGTLIVIIDSMIHI